MAAKTRLDSLSKKDRDEVMRIGAFMDDREMRHASTLRAAWSCSGHIVSAAVTRLANVFVGVNTPRSEGGIQ